MNALATVFIVALAAGLLLGFVLHKYMTPQLRPRVERLCLTTGGRGALFMVVPWAIMTAPRPSKSWSRSA